MEILSPVHGKIIYSEDEIIKFEKSLPGFEELTSYVIKDIEESSFKLLQSIEDENICFVIISPFDIEEKYEIELSDDIIKRLSISTSNEVMLYSLVTLNKNPEKITANLRAPLVLNINERKAEQFIVDKDVYKIKHPMVKGR